MVKQNLNTESKQANSYFPPQEGDLLEEFERTHPTYKLFKEKGLNKDKGEEQSTIDRLLSNGDQALFKGHRTFLNKVDLSKGPVERKVVRLERRKDLNPETHKMQESLVIHTHWVAQDFLGNRIEYDDIKEGMYNKPVVTTEIVNGKRLTRYSNWQAVYDIPFSKEAVDEALENQINPPELVNYFVRYNTTRDDTFTLEQFQNLTFDQCQEISRQGKGLNR